MKQLLLLISLLYGLASCSTTQCLKDNEQLYTGIKSVKITYGKEPCPKDYLSKKDWEKRKIRQAEDVMVEVEAALDCPPNNSFLGSSSMRTPLPFGLWIYNALYEAKRPFPRWFNKKFGAEPVLIQEVNPEIRTHLATNTLHEYGYFNATSHYTLHTNQKDQKKQAVSYRIDIGDPYLIDSIHYLPISPRIDSLIEHHHKEMLLVPRRTFKVITLNAERERVSNLLRENGYYYFRPSFLRFQADSTQGTHKIQLRVSLKESIPPKAIHTWKIGNIDYKIVDSDNQAPFDTLQFKEYNIAHNGKLNVRPAILTSNLTFKKGDFYNLANHQETQSNYARLGIFKYTSMNYEKDSLRSDSILNLTISTDYALPYDGEAALNLLAKSNNMAGPGVSVSMAKRNIFGGGERLNITANGSYEWQTGQRINGDSKGLNNYELGLTGKLTIPRLFMPTRWGEKGTTSFELSGDQLRQAGFYSILSLNGNVTLEKKTSSNSTYTFTPFSLTYSLLGNTTQDFNDIVDENPSLALSFRDQFIPSMQFSYTYDESNHSIRSDRIHFKTTFTESGNLLSGVYALSGEAFDQKDKELFDNPFAQFLKIESDFSYNHCIDQNNWLVGHIGVGALYSYGNSNIAPYIQQFYVGGATSLRGFTIRSVGPGTYTPEANNPYAYIDQTGNLKMEANVELRFRIYNDWYGAGFIDAGNTWLMKEDSDRPGGKLNLSNFFDSVATDVGVGIRYDWNFLVIRFDVGFAIHAPYETGEKGYYNIPDFTKGIGYHLAIGYPF